MELDFVSLESDAKVDRNKNLLKDDHLAVLDVLRTSEESVHDIKQRIDEINQELKNLGIGLLG